MKPTRVFIIAEVGVNHNGDTGMARQLVQVAAEAGADAVKFQTFRADALVRRDTPKAEYQKVTTGAEEGQYEMLSRLELSEAAHRELAAYCAKEAIEFLSTPFDEESADLLERIGVTRYKIGSGEISNLLLLRHVAAKRKPMILSTGMSTMEDIRQAVEAVRAAGTSDLQLLHCVSDYPTLPEDVNLRVIKTLRERFDVPVGFSDHTSGVAMAMGAVALGASIIEKHVTLDRNLPGPDHRLSLEPEDLRAMIRGIREVEAGLGNGVKTMTPGELLNQAVCRRSLVAAESLSPGTIVEARHLKAKRPGTGISPMDLDKVVGKRLKLTIAKDEPIVLEYLE